MPVIRQLPLSLQNRIAAGEVIERPAAVVKELVENAIDAGARMINIEVAGSGAEFIRVSDDGTGMQREDLELCISRHATSKLKTDDLLDIHTLGFRGEALPSIGAVAQLSITTKHNEEPHGWSLTVINSEIGATKPAARERGTTVEVRELFHAFPARLKFLKSERAERAAISEVMERLALANPQTSFSWRFDNNMPRVIHGVDEECPSHTRLETVFGATLVRDAFDIQAQSGYFVVRGVAGRPSQHHPTGRMQFIFVNGRPVRDRLLYGAMRAAYGDTLRRDRFPFAVIFIDVPVHEVDVNVHPAKTEIRFRDNAGLRSLLVRAVRDGLYNAGITPVSNRIDEFISPPSMAFTPAGFSENAQARFEHDMAPTMRSEVLSQEQLHYPLGAARAQLHATYILSETRDGMILVDQHAAHERIVYERLKRGSGDKNLARQILLVPEIINLSAAQSEALLSETQELARWGFIIENFGPDTIIVREVPAMFGEGNMQKLFRDLADEILTLDHSTKAQDRLWSIASRIACHGSVRAGRVLKMEEMNALLREMEATPLAATCNHGRPTYIHLAKSDLERLFNRR